MSFKDYVLMQAAAFKDACNEKRIMYFRVDVNEFGKDGFEIVFTFREFWHVRFSSDDLHGDYVYADYGHNLEYVQRYQYAKARNMVDDVLKAWQAQLFAR